jgi:hypothetical protein
MRLSEQATPPNGRSNGLPITGTHRASNRRMTAISSSQEIPTFRKSHFAWQRRSLQTDAHPARRAGAQGQASSYQRLTQPPPPPTLRLTQPPPPPPPLIQPPPRTPPLRLTQPPARAVGAEENQAPAARAATIAAPDHFPTLRRNNRRWSNSVSADIAFSLDDSLFIRQSLLLVRSVT